MCRTGNIRCYRDRLVFPRLRGPEVRLGCGPSDPKTTPPRPARRLFGVVVLGGINRPPGHLVRGLQACRTNPPCPACPAATSAPHRPSETPTGSGPREAVRDPRPQRGWLQ
jgi:hypothetical protein